ncbi:hypothetical protein EV200_106215 [Pedobacter psychrotolerans]|uniref:Uncharacterized protein n=1 Tax=Pedobacter psychrotolerans TaxID=1843235 RepID=A0A4R2H7W2_9SPHI|nr:hypothetical protein [Pedobacter psychrotolerans]TCO22573.1 hypothetical protein EV200_106215 [Pedobacter psychrotolerans]GGE65594.1 hypothetical protein GCM10011413_35080 [Pedobacter psychrotolerans]
MIKLEIQASAAEINELITLLSSNAKFDHIRKQIVDFKDQSTHNQDDEIPKEGDDKFIERSE